MVDEGLIANKIAIYGDSYADCDNLGGYVGWPDYLARQHFPTYIIDNFGSSATSLDYSYNIFLNKHKNYDINIFVATFPGRLRLQLPEKTLKLLKENLNNSRVEGILNCNGPQWFERLDDTALYIANKNCKHFVKQLQKQMKAFLSYRSIDADNLYFSLLIKKIKTQLKKTDIFLSTKELKLISNLDLPTSDLKEQNTFANKNIDKRACHLNDTNNKILAEKIANFIYKGHAITLNPTEFVSTTEELSKLFKPL